MGVGRDGDRSVKIHWDVINPVVIIRRIHNPASGGFVRPKDFQTDGQDH